MHAERQNSDKIQECVEKRECVGLLKVCENWVNGAAWNKIRENFTVGIFVAFNIGHETQKTLFINYG